jgi:Matrixin
MIRLKSPVLRLESLEDRAVPAVFGEPWLDGRHVTLSFAADGTSLSGVGSNLTSALSPLGWDAARVELLRAFQTWAVNANLNVGLVGDSNAKFGQAGAIQRDPRFGDIRIGARTLSNDVIAITSPFSLITPTAGDLILNSGKAFSIGNVVGKYDLFTVLMQESGHAFGIGNSVDPNSVMYEDYGSARTGLSAGDITDVRALYGERTKDKFEGSGGNDTLATATTYSGSVEADLTNTADVDVYRYTAENSGAAWFRVKAAKLSLVAARVEVLNAADEVIASAEATGPLQNDVTVYADQLVAGETYYVRVAAARSDVFGVGAYRLVVDATEAGSSDPDPYALVDAETDANNTVVTAAAPAPSTGPYDYSFRSSLSTSTDVDFFRIHSPASGSSNLTVTVAGVGQTWFNPNVDLYTTAGVRITTKVVAQTDSSVVLSLQGATADTDYLIRVASGNGTSGNFDVVADFRHITMPKMMGSTGSLNSIYTSTSATLVVWQSQTIQVNLLANHNGNDTFSLVRLYDSQNRVVFELYSQTGVLSTGHVFLKRGLYRVEVQRLGGSIDFSLTMFGVTDPIAIGATDPSGGDDLVLPERPDANTTIAIQPPPITPPPVIWF